MLHFGVAQPQSAYGERRIARGVLNEALVDLDAIAHNVRLMRQVAGSAELMAVVKANAYGHGQNAVARTAVRNGAAWLGVATASEALSLRRSGLKGPILMWLHSPGEDLRTVLAEQIDVAVSASPQLHDLAAQAPTGANVHLKIDTGMARGGASPGDWPALVSAAARLERAGRIRVRGIWSHLADADTLGSRRSAEQLRTFQQALAFARTAGLKPPLVHLANSAGAFALPKSRYDMVRSGLAIYGIEPVPGHVLGLRPALTLQTSVILTRRIRAGAHVSYGQQWRARTDTTLALVPLGFADGIPRQAGRNASVWINGVRCPVAGSITMDQLMVDVGDVPVRAGDPAIVFGAGLKGEPTVTDWAQWAETIPSDILCAISDRVPRRYVPQSRRTSFPGETA